MLNLFIPKDINGIPLVPGTLYVETGSLSEMIVLIHKIKEHIAIGNFGRLQYQGQTKLMLLTEYRKN